MSVPEFLIKTKSDQKAIADGCYFNIEKALKVKKFCETFCIQSKAPWAGQPLKLLPYQWDNIIQPLYGWYTAEHDRRFSTASIWIPKKQGKSTLSSALCLFHLLEQPGSEVYCIAADTDQANIVFSEASKMVQASPFFSRRLKVLSSKLRIEDKKNNSVFKVLSSLPSGKAGFSANLIVMDEIAIWGSTAQAVWDQLSEAGIARKNSLKIIISTAQYDRQHIGYQQYRYAKDVEESNIVDTTILPVIYEVPENAECICGKCVGDKQGWRCPEWWAKANPALNITVPMQKYWDKYKEVENDPTKEAKFRTLLMNSWVGHSQMWIASNVWAKCKEDFDESRFLGKECYVGIDAAQTKDLMSYCLIFREEDKYYLLPRFYMPEQGALLKEKIDKVPYTYWARQNLIKLCPGVNIDLDVFTNDIVEDSKKFKFQEVRYDPKFLFETAPKLLHEYDLPMYQLNQNVASMSPPTAFFQQKTLEYKIIHNGHPILAWCLGNCTIKPKMDVTMIDKQRCSGRIDGIVAAVIGLSGAMQYQQAVDFFVDFF